YSAARRSCVDVARLLVAHEADVNAVDMRGRNLLQCSLSGSGYAMECAEFCRLLLEHNADPYTPSDRDPTAIFDLFVVKDRGFADNGVPALDVLWEFMFDT